MRFEEHLPRLLAGQYQREVVVGVLERCRNQNADRVHFEKARQDRS
jgi:hypothetical protein